MRFFFVALTKLKVQRLPQSIDVIEKLIDQGRYFEARSRAEKALDHSQDLRLKQLYALALSKSGVPEAAIEFMEPVYRQFPDDPESAGIMGSICKELFKKNQSNPFAIRARDTYLKNFSATKNSYTGINAASMSAMAGQLSKGREIAAEVILLLEGKSNDFWSLATLGEAHMLNKNKPKAIEYYTQARKEAGKDWGKITSVHNQLWLLNHFIPLPVEILKLFKPPGVAAFVGHMIDHPLRKEPRFPPSIEQKIKDQIVHAIHSLNVHIGYCSLACGGDILFAESMAEEGREVNIFLPFKMDDFIKVSVQFGGDHWVSRFNALRERFPVTFISNESYGGLDDIFAFQTRIIFGSAALRSESYHDEPFLLTVLSEVDLKRKEGGTRDTIGLWPFPQRHTNINPDIFIIRSTPAMPSPKSEAAPREKSLNRPVLYLAYIDLTQLTPSEREKIITGFEERRSEEQDAYLIIESTDPGMLVAFGTESGLIEYVRFILGSIATFRNAAPYKISLHAGPVYLDGPEHSLNKNMSGATVELVKEMNHFTTEGSIFASDEFAALLALKGKMFSVEYGGIIEFPQAARNTPIYKISFNSSR